MRQMDMIEPELPLDGGTCREAPPQPDRAAVKSRPLRAAAPADFTLTPPRGPARKPAPEAPEPFTLPI
jgi:hypothetical protein